MLSEHEIAPRDRVQRVIQDVVAPALQMDGTAIEVVDVSDGVARLRFDGGCSGCPSSLIAIVMCIEQELRKHFPEIEYVETVP